MTFPKINNVTFEVYDFTEHYIEEFSRIILEFVMKKGILDALSAEKTNADGKIYRPSSLLISLPDDLF